MGAASGAGHPTIARRSIDGSVPGVGHAMRAKRNGPARTRRRNSRRRCSSLRRCNQNDGKAENNVRHVYNGEAHFRPLMRGDESERSRNCSEKWRPHGDSNPGFSLERVEPPPHFPNEIRVNRLSPSRVYDMCTTGSRIFAWAFSPTCPASPPRVFQPASGGSASTAWTCNYVGDLRAHFGTMGRHLPTFARVTAVPAMRRQSAVADRGVGVRRCPALLPGERSG